MRNLVLVLGDQLDLGAAAFDGFDPTEDAVWMAEAAEESKHVWSSQPRIAIFLSAMRHFAVALRDAGRPLHYQRMDDLDAAPALAAALEISIERLRPAALVMTEPGDARVLAALRAAASRHGLTLDVRADRHFFNPVRTFAAHAGARRQLRMEFFYREMRRRHRVLMDGDEPCGGQWNFDADNREAFDKGGPPNVPDRARFEPDALEHGYAHHIQRLTVTGLYALPLGVAPRQVHEWYLAVYVDAVEWVELPNTLGMSQAADGGLMATKPYIAGGKYIERQSGGSLCARCRYRPGERIGERACPFTTLYWDFLIRHEAMLAKNPRTVMQVRNLARVSGDERARIARRASAIRAGDVD